MGVLCLSDSTQPAVADNGKDSKVCHIVQKKLVRYGIIDPLRQQSKILQPGFLPFDFVSPLRRFFDLVYLEFFPEFLFTQPFGMQLLIC